MNQPQQYPQQQPPVSNRKNNLKNIIALLVIILVAGGGVAFCAMKVRQNRAETQERERVAREQADTTILASIQKAKALHHEGKLEEAVRELETATSQTAGTSELRLEAHRLLDEYGQEYGKQFEDEVAAAISDANDAINAGDADAAEKHLNSALEYHYAPNVDGARELLALLVEARSEAKMKSFVAEMSDAEFAAFKAEGRVPNRTAFDRREIDTIFKTTLKANRDQAEEWRDGSSSTPERTVEPRHAPYKAHRVVSVDALNFPDENNWRSISDLYGSWNSLKSVKNSNLRKRSGLTVSQRVREGVVTSGGEYTCLSNASGQIVAFRHILHGANAARNADHFGAFKKGRFLELLLRDTLGETVSQQQLDEYAKVALDDGVIIVKATNGYLFAGWTGRDGFTVQFAAWDASLAETKLRRTGVTIYDVAAHAIEAGLRIEIAWQEPGGRRIPGVSVVVSFDDRNALGYSLGSSGGSLTYVGEELAQSGTARLTVDDAPATITSDARTVMDTLLFALAIDGTSVSAADLKEAHQSAKKQGTNLLGEVERAGVVFELLFPEQPDGFWISFG